MALTKETRDALPDSDFAVPAKRQLPINDAVHVRMAWSQVSRTQGLTDAERKEARARIMHKAESLGLDVTEWHTISSMAFQAMAIHMPAVEGHPNRMPFSGVLTRVDEPSDNAPYGSKQKRVLLPRDVAERALPSLLGMAVNIDAGFAGHDPKAKVGVITAASIVGSAINIEGFIYASDFPEETAAIQIDKDKLGFSFEAKQVSVENMDADPLVITGCVFTGAAILLKNNAAYTTTSLAARRDDEEDDSMNEEMKKLFEGFATQLASVSAAVEEMKKGTVQAGTDHTKAAVEPHATALEGVALAMEAASVGNHPASGHAVALRRMAGSLRAEAALGKVPHVYADYSVAAGADKGADKVALAAATEAATKPLLDKLAVLDTQMADLKAAAFKNAEQPGRKTLAPAVTAILAKAGLGEPEAGAQLDAKGVSEALKKAGLDTQQVMASKSALARAGLLA
jgi:hypothetical protein